MESSLQLRNPSPGPWPSRPPRSTSGTAEKRRGQGARLTEDIVSGALALIERTGSAEAVTLRAVAQEVGIAAPSIYAHFPDRDAVLMAVVVRIFDELTQTIKQGQKSAGQDPADRLVAGCEAYVAFGLEHPARYGVLFSAQRRAAPDYCKPVPIGPDGRPALEFGAGIRAPRPGRRGLRHGRGLREHQRRRRCHRRVGRPARDRQPARGATTLPVARPGRIRPPPRAVASPSDRLRIKRLMGLGSVPVMGASELR